MPFYHQKITGAVLLGFNWQIDISKILNASSNTPGSATVHCPQEK